MNFGKMALYRLPLTGTRLHVLFVLLIVAPSFILFGYNQAVLRSLLNLRSSVEVFPDIDTIDTTGAQNLTTRHLKVHAMPLSKWIACRGFVALPVW
jgi:hypothetical protein